MARKKKIQTVEELALEVQRIAAELRSYKRRTLERGFRELERAMLVALLELGNSGTKDSLLDIIDDFRDRVGISEFVRTMAILERKKLIEKDRFFGKQYYSLTSKGIKQAHKHMRED